MVPPDFFVSDYYAFADTIHQNYVQAIKQNNIHYVVNLSSIGVTLAGTGSLEKYYNMEKQLDTITGLNVVHLRPAMFYTNFYGGLEIVKHQNIIGHNVGGKVDLLMTHPADIADTAFTFLDSLSFSGHQVKYIISDVKNGSEIAELLSKAIGKPVNWIEFSDDALLAGLMQNGFSRETAEVYIVAAGRTIREGLFDEFKENKYTEPGSRKFVEFAREFAKVYLSL